MQLGEGRDDTRRQQPVAALRSAGDDPGEFDATLRHLTRHRLLTLTGGDQGPGEGTSRADLAHEALISAWPTLRNWVDEDREGLRVRAQLADDAQVWTGMNRNPDALYRGRRLLAASDWAERHPGQLAGVEQEFLTAGHDARSASWPRPASRLAAALAAGGRALSVLLAWPACRVLAVRSANKGAAGRIANSQSCRPANETRVPSPTCRSAQRGRLRSFPPPRLGSACRTSSPAPPSPAHPHRCPRAH